MAGEVYDTWPAGALWVFQGTVGEDATAGTHVCTLTVTPGAGNEMQVLYGYLTVGATATAQVVTARIDDGTNDVGFPGPIAFSGTTSGAVYSFPMSLTPSATTNNPFMAANPSILVSGTMRLRLMVSTAAVSVTQTFAVVCRIKGAMPTATLNDTIGTSTNTVNTNRVF